MSSVIFLSFVSASNSSVNCGSASGATGVDNLISSWHQDGITFEAWIRPSGWGGTNAGRIFSKGQWQLYIEQSSGEFRGLYSDTSTGALSGVPFTVDGSWHHVAATFHSRLGVGDRKWHLFVDGVEGTYSVQTALGSPLSDAANSLILGNNFAGGNFATDGDIAWMRITKTKLYTTSFTPPDRCSIPTPDEDTVGLWITEGTGATTYNLGFATADGTINSCTWGTESCGGAWWQVV